MKLLLTTLLMLIPTTLNANGAGDDNDWKFISELTLTKEEKRVEVNKMITAIKESDNTQEDIDYMVDFWIEYIEDDGAIHRILNQSELDVNFPQLHKLSKLGSCASGMEGYNRMYNPDYTHTYEPEVIDDIRVNTRELLCKFEEDDAKGPGYLCRYTTALSYYTHKPDSNFKVNGDIVPQNAVGIAKSWIDRTFVVSEIETAFDRLPEWLSDLSYKDGKYIIGFSGCGCSGSVGVSPVTIDGVLHLKVTSEASLMCS